MSTNSELAEIFRGIADLLDVQGEKFKPQAYRRAAQSLDALPDDVRQIAARGELRSIPGVGDAIAEKIREYLRDGRVPYYDRLSQEVPAGVRELMRLPGVGLKTTRRFLTEFGIEGPAELGTAIDAGRLVGAAGFGPKKIEQLRKAVAAGTPSGARTPLLQAWRVAEALVAALKAQTPVDQIVVAGSLRRRRETVGDLDILVTSATPEAVFNAFSALPTVREVRLRGPTKETVVVEGGLQVDLRVVEPASFGAALQYFTGSKEHNVSIRTRARDRGLRVNEYAVTRGDERVAGRTEEEVYASLGLPYIPPEIRENVGEIEAAEKGALPKLVEPTDVHGDLHVHLPANTSPAHLDARIAAAGSLGWSFLGFIPPRDGDGLTAEAARHLAQCRTRTGSPVRVLIGTEVGADATPPPSGADYVILDLRATADPPSEEATRAVGAIVAAHLAAVPPGGKDGSGTRRWLAWAATTGTALEVTPSPQIEGLDSGAVRNAVGQGAKLHLTAGARSPADELDASVISLGLARRGWATADAVINRRPPPRR